MSRAVRLLTAFCLGLFTLLIPATGYAGGGAPVGGGPGAGGFGGLVVTVDHPSPANHNFSYLDYFPRTAVVHQGDVLTFQWALNPNAIHTVTFLPAGTPLKAGALNRLFGPALNGVPGPRGGPAPFFFPLFAHQGQGCGNSPYFPGTAPCSYDGSQALNSGLLVPATTGPAGKLIPNVPAPTFSVRFNAKPGVYHWFCLVHGGNMNGTVRVLPSGAATPSVESQEARAAAQYATGSRNAIAHEQQTASKVPPPTTTAGHTTYSVLAGDQYGRVEIDEFIPRLANVKAGDSVNYIPGGFHTITEHSLAAHPVDFFCAAGNRLLPFRGRFAGCKAGFGVTPAGLPQRSPQAWPGPPVNSGLIVIPRPHTFTVQFSGRGVFHYECRVHTNMTGVVNIT